MNLIKPSSLQAEIPITGSLSMLVIKAQIMDSPFVLTLECADSFDRNIFPIVGAQTDFRLS